MIITVHPESGRAARAATGLAWPLLAAMASLHAQAQAPRSAADTADASKTMQLIRQSFAARRVKIGTLQFDMKGVYRFNPDAPPWSGLKEQQTWSDAVPLLQSMKTFNKSIHVAVQGQNVRADQTYDVWNVSLQAARKDQQRIDIQQGGVFKGWHGPGDSGTVYDHQCLLWSMSELDDGLAHLGLNYSTLGQYDFSIRNLDDYRRGKTPFVTIGDSPGALARLTSDTVSARRAATSQARVEYDLDPARDYVPVARRSWKADGTLASEAQIEYAADPRAGHLPSHVKITTYYKGHPDFITELDCSGFMLGEPIDPKIFQLDRPPGTEVNDSRQRR